jgi:hypothetical protein
MLHMIFASNAEPIKIWSTAVAELRAAAQDSGDQQSDLRLGLAEAREQLLRLQRCQEHAARHHRCHVRLNLQWTSAVHLHLCRRSAAGIVYKVSWVSRATSPLVQDTKDAVMEAATAGALDRRLAALERRVNVA